MLEEGGEVVDVLLDDIVGRVGRELVVVVVVGGDGQNSPGR